MLINSRINRHGEIILREKLAYVSGEDKDPVRQFKDLRPKIFEKDRGICGGCDKPANPDYVWEADHIKAHISGEETTIENGQVMHPKCNRKKWDASDRKFADSSHLGEQVTETVIETLVSLMIQDLIYTWTKKLMRKVF